MICGQCGGNCEWKGPLSNLTHSECSKCGGVNTHLPDMPDFEEVEITMAMVEHAFKAGYEAAAGNEYHSSNAEDAWLQYPKTGERG